MNYKEDGTYKKLLRNFRLHMLCNLTLAIIVVWAFISSGVGAAGFPMIMLGVSFIAIGVTYGCIAKRIEYLK